MNLTLKLNINKRSISLIIVAIVVIISGLFAYIYTINQNPIPKTIKNQVAFKIIYPSTHLAQIDTSSYQYQSDNQILSFSASYANQTILFTEQRAPSSLGSDSQVYYPALGIHPYAQFKTSLGIVALTKFWQSGTLTPIGQSAIMAARGTMLTTHTDKSLSNQQWKDLFDSLKITR